MKDSLLIATEQDDPVEHDCSRERFTGLLPSLGRPDLERFLAEPAEIEVRRHSCDRFYRYQPRDLGGAGADA